MVLITEEMVIPRADSKLAVCATEVFLKGELNANFNPFLIQSFSVVKQCFKGIFLFVRKFSEKNEFKMSHFQF